MELAKLILSLSCVFNAKINHGRFIYELVSDNNMSFYTFDFYFQFSFFMLVYNVFVFSSIHQLALSG